MSALFQNIENAKTKNSGALVQVSFPPQNSCARRLFPKMMILKGGRTFKKWGLVEGGWILTTLLHWCHAFVLVEL